MLYGYAILSDFQLGVEQWESLFLMEAASSCTEQIIPEKKIPAETLKKKERKKKKVCQHSKVNWNCRTEQTWQTCNISNLVDILKEAKKLNKINPDIKQVYKLNHWLRWLQIQIEKCSYK